MPSFISRFWSKEKKIINLLSNKATLCGGESITAGLIASRIASVSGASSCFKGGVVCYTNDMKINLLGVLPATINKYSAVSPQTVLEMLKGVYAISASDFGYAISGYAGPSGNAGEVYIGLYHTFLQNKNEVAISLKSICKTIKFCKSIEQISLTDSGLACFLFSCKFSGQRNQIRKRAANVTLQLIDKMVASSVKATSNCIAKAFTDC